MAQGFKPRGGGKPGLKKGNNNIKAVKAQQKKKVVKKGNPVQMPKRGMNYDEAHDERLLSKEIARASEQQCSAKLIQSGSKLTLTDLRNKGKELNRETRRDELKKKVGVVDAKIAKLIKKQER